MSTKYTRARFGAAVVVAFLCGLVFASGFDLTKFSWAQSRLGSAATKPSPAQVASAAETETAFEAVADHARPAVVSIEVETFARARPMTNRRGRGQQGQGQGQGQQDLPPGIEDFFRQFDGGQTQPSDQPEEASGSGFIVSPDGYILTNNHVVADADKVTVTLFDKREFEAKVIGRDPTTDVAVIKIDGKNFPTVSLGDDANARVGQWVLAIGNPLQLNFTVTAGIVSAKGRNQSGLLNNQYAITDYIQTDAAINPGNSGGPLLNIHGDVIGINSAIASGTGYYAGYGFAIPITLAKQVMDDLIKYGKARRALVGVSLNDVTATDARAAGLATIGGAKVQGFPSEDSPAEKAGIQIGDIIVAAGGHPIDQVSTLQRVIRGFKPGDNVNLDVMRFGQKKSFTVKLGEPPEANSAVAANAVTPTADVPSVNPSIRSFDKIGISVAPVSTEMAAQLTLTSDEKAGLQVTHVAGNGPSYRELAPMDIILSELYPTKRAIHSTSDLDAALSSVKPGDVLEMVVCSPDPTTRSCATRAVSVQISK
ncbi:MAG TPA: trypsin-like peptidase domain-containing protein [Gemmatimonadaceae bacterium]|jgi:serine protease Do